MEQFVDAEVSLASIYRPTPLLLRARAESEFRLTVGDAVPIDLPHGRILPDGMIESTPKDSAHLIEALLLHAIEERQVGSDSTLKSPFRYGMRYFPFISSRLRVKLRFHQVSVRTLMIRVNHPYRTIPAQSKINGASVAISPDRRSPLTDVYDDNSMGLVWFPQEQCQVCELDIALKLAGAAFARLVRFPLMYWLVALVAIAGAGLLSKPGITFASLIAALTVFLGLWMQGDRPQRVSLLAAAYCVGALFMVGWTALFILIPSWWTLLALLAPALIAWRTARILDKFDETGVLPSAVVRFWRATVQHVLARREP